VRREEGEEEEEEESLYKADAVNEEEEEEEGSGRGGGGGKFPDRAREQRGRQGCQEGKTNMRLLGCCRAVAEPICCLPVGAQAHARAITKRRVTLAV